jgi:hypothetical protein
MSKWTSVVLTALACCLSVPALSLETARGCPPPPQLTQDYVKKTVRVEIQGKLSHLQMAVTEPRFPKPPAVYDFWQISAGGKTYRLDFGAGKDLLDLANKLESQTVIATGTLDGTVVHLTGLKADEGSVKETTEVEVRGRLQSLLTRCGPGSRAWQVVVDGKTYSLDFATPELRKLAETLDGEAVVLSGTQNNDAVISVKTLTAADHIILDLPPVKE